MGVGNGMLLSNRMRLARILQNVSHTIRMVTLVCIQKGGVPLAKLGVLE